MEEELEKIKMKKVEEMLKKMSKRDKSEFPDYPITVTDLDFNQFVDLYPLTAVDFWAPWCAPCRMIAPTIQDLAKTYAGRVVFGKLNVDENPETSWKYEVTSIPTLLVMKKGVELDRIVGFAPKVFIESVLKKYL